MNNTCILDNWSLYLVSKLLNKKREISDKPFNPSITTTGISKNVQIELEALSNLINSIIFYDYTLYVSNGREYSWMKNELLNDLQINNIIIRKSVPKSIPYIYDPLSDNYNIAYYLSIAQKTNSDIFISPYRSNLVQYIHNPYSIIEITESLLKNMDFEIKRNIQKDNDYFLKKYVESNLIMPPMLQFVLNESQCINDIFKIAVQIKESDYIKQYKNKISDILSSNFKTKNYQKFRIEVQSILNQVLVEFNLKQIEKEKLFDCSFSLGILKIGGIDVKTTVNNTNHNISLALFRHIAQCRLEAANAIDSYNRIFI